MQKIDYPGVIKPFEAIEDYKELNILTDLCLGGDLHTLLKSRPAFSSDEASLIIKSVLLSVNYLHNIGIIHRGINSKNVMLPRTNDSLAVLIDFGLSADTSREAMPFKTPSGNIP